MAYTPTSLLSLPIITTGSESGLWGDVTNNGLTQYLDIAIAGRNALTSANFTAGALTLANTAGTNSTTNIAATSAQYSTLYVSSLATNSTITAPSSNRNYLVINADSTYTLTVKASGQTGITFSPGQSGLVAFNGTDYALVGTIGPTVPVARGGTNATATPTAGAVAYGTGSAYAFTAAGTAGYLLQSNGSSAPTWVPAPSSGVTTISFGSTGLTPSTATGGAVSVAGTLAVANGGTGTTSLTANNVILGNGTSAVQLVAPGSSGNVLTSNGTTWASSTPAGGFSNIAVFTSSGTWSVPSGITKCKVTVTGAGGSSGATGGNAGGTAIKILSLSGGSATITVGAGAINNPGGTSSFVYSATTVSATGGGIGGYTTPSSTFGNGSGGDINIKGGGGQGYGAGTNDPGGNGGASYWGGGGSGARFGSAPYNAGQAYGSGGGGYGYDGGSSAAGQDGVIVIEY